MTGHDAEEFGGALYDELVEKTEASWSRWLAALERVPDDRLDEPGVSGEWSVKDLMGHVAVWDGVAIEKIRGIQEGIPPDVHEVNETTDEFNARTAQERAGHSVDDQRGDMTMTHQRLLGALEGASRASDDMLTQIKEKVAEDTWEHYDEHTRQVTARFGGG